MIFLLDVNALLAMRYADHVHHARVVKWASRLVREHDHDEPVFATCPITELGFVRIGSGKAGYAASVEIARADLQMLRTRRNMLFVPDGIPTHCLPAWVRKSAQTTDGYLLELAKSHGGHLATLDRFIPGALLIPDDTEHPLMVREEPVTADLVSHQASLVSEQDGSRGIAIRSR